MSGYRTSNFDPGHYERAGKPMRPFNWVQWTGVALVVAGLAIELVYLSGRLGWTHPMLDSPAAVTGLTLAGVALVNSRREPAIDPAPELAAARRRWLMIISLICLAVLGAATIMTFSGA